MEPNPERSVSVLDKDECWRLLETAELDRLAVAPAGEPEIFPINFVVDGASVVFRTAEGTKLAALTVASQVALEADGYDAGTGVAWSVVEGQSGTNRPFSDSYAAEGLPLFSRQAGPKQWFARITGPIVSGRRFTVVRRGGADSA